MGGCRRTRRYGSSPSYGPVHLGPVGCLLAGASLLPILVLGPLGPGLIVIHEHHEEHLHAHKAHWGSHEQPTPCSGHDHPTDGAVDFEGAEFVLTLPDLPRLSTQVQTPGCELKPASSIVMIPTVSSNLKPKVVMGLAAQAFPIGTLRAPGRIAELLLSGHSLLI